MCTLRPATRAPGRLPAAPDSGPAPHHEAPPPDDPDPGPPPDERYIPPPDDERLGPPLDRDDGEFPPAPLDRDFGPPPDDPRFAPGDDTLDASAAGARSPGADTSEYRSAIGEPAPATPTLPAGVQVSNARQAALVLGAELAGLVRQALARAIGAADTGRALGLSPDDLDALSRGRAPAPELQIRGQAETMESLVEIARKAARLGDDAEVPEIEITSRGIKEVRLAKGSPPALKRVALEWWR